jgi:hypothetical protein
VKKSNFKIVVVDPEEQNVYLCRQLQTEGNVVKLLSKDMKTDLYDRLNSPGEILDWNPDFVLFTRPGLGSLAYKLYSNGIKVVAGGLIQDNFIDLDYVHALTARCSVLMADLGEPTQLFAGLFSKVGFCGPALQLDLRDDRTVYLRRSENEEMFYTLQRVTSAVDFCGWLFVEMQGNTISRITPYTPDGFWAAFLEGLSQPLGWMLQSLAFLEKRKRFRFQFTEEVVGAAKVTIPPYPLNVCWENLPDVAEQDLVYRMIRRACKDVPLAQDAEFHPLEISRSDEGQLIATGTNVGWVTASGFADTVPLELQLKLGHVIQRPSVPDPEFDPITVESVQEETVEEPV